MNIHGAKHAGHRRRKACRLWTGGGPQRAYSGRGGGILCRHTHSLLKLTADFLETTVYNQWHRSQVINIEKSEGWGLGSCMQLSSSVNRGTLSVAFRIALASVLKD